MGEKDGGIIEKCENYGYVQGKYYCGGIMGTAEGVTINECRNYETVGGTYWCGGILGWHETKDVNISNCLNNSKISTSSGAGGIVGRSSGVDWNSELVLNIKNCYNKGELNTVNQCGGIIGSQDSVVCKSGVVNIENCYNIAKSGSTKYGGIIGTVSVNDRTKTNITNTYYLSTIANSGIINGTYTGKIESKDETYMKSKTFVDLLNQNIGENSEWKRWKQGENGYPEFE